MKTPLAISAQPVLTASQESFAVHYSTFGDAVAAYRHAYNVTTTRRATLQTNAYQVLHHPKVAARITALRNAAAVNELATRESLIADLEAMVSVTTDELIQLRVVPCPACWPTPDAWTDAAAAALDAGHDAPPADEPNARCTVCAGAGRNVGQLTSTADLSLPARRMFKGLEFFPDGGVKRVLLHDAAQLRIELHKIKGLHIERSVSLNATVNVPAMPKNMTVEQAMELLSKLAPVPADADDTPDDSNVVSADP